MLIPTKHENLQKNLLVLGSDIIKILKNGSLNIEDLFQKLNLIKSINLDQFHDTLLFLWLAELIQFNDFNFSLSKNNFSEVI